MNQSKEILIDGFTRKETIALTNCSSSRLAYLEKVDLIIPQRLEKTGRSLVLFSCEQILAITIFKKFRKEGSPKDARRIIAFLCDKGYSNIPENDRLILIDDALFWSDSTFQEIPRLIKDAKHEKEVKSYKIIVSPPFREVIHIISNNARNSKVINFDSFSKRFSRITLNAEKE